MQVFDAIIRLAGSPMNEVRKEDITAPEVMVLRALHGQDAVTRLVKRKMDKRSHFDERNRLVNIYGRKVMIELFGAEHNKLPVDLPEMQDPYSDPEPAQAAA